MNQACWYLFCQPCFRSQCVRFISAIVSRTLYCLGFCVDCFVKKLYVMRDQHADAVWGSIGPNSVELETRASLKRAVLLILKTLCNTNYRALNCSFLMLRLAPLSYKYCIDERLSFAFNANKMSSLLKCALLASWVRIITWRAIHSVDIYDRFTYVSHW